MHKLYESTTLKKNAISDSDLRKAARVAELRHFRDGVGDPYEATRRVEFGEALVDHGLDDVSHRLRLSHDRAQGALVIHGITHAVADLPADLRASLLYSSAAFSAAATVAEQSSAREQIGHIVGQALERDAELRRRVKERLVRERFD